MVRHSVTEIIRRQLDVFQELGTTMVALHQNFSYPHRMFSFNEKLELWVETLDALLPEAEMRNITLILENCLNSKENMKLLKMLFKKYPTLGFLLDVGHANLHAPANTTSDYLKHFKHRLKHMHLSDNFGRRDDLHLPIGAGGIPWRHVLGLIKKTGYDQTVTLEVFSRERNYLVRSREYLRTIWNSI